MDEPFVSLGGETAETMLKLTESLIAEHQPATLFVTHDMREANRLADRVLTLRSDPAGAVVEGISLPTAPAAYRPPAPEAIVPMDQRPTMH